MLLTVRLPVPLLLSVRLRVIVLFTVTFPKDRLPVTVICGAAAIPVPVAERREFPALEATVMFELKLPAAEGWNRTVTFCDALGATVTFEELPRMAKRDESAEVMAETFNGPEAGLVMEKLLVAFWPTATFPNDRFPERDIPGAGRMRREKGAVPVPEVLVAPRLREKLPDFVGEPEREPLAELKLRPVSDWMSAAGVPIFAGAEMSPGVENPQVTTEPSRCRAAKAPEFAKTAVTFEERLAAMEEESPPKLAEPQVTTEPSFFKAAKANPVA